MVKKEIVSEVKKQNRWVLLRKIDEITAKPLIYLSFIWLILIIIDLSIGLKSIFLKIFYAIWLLFIADFIIEMIIAPNKWNYLKSNWLNAISIMIPGFRLLNIFKGFRLIQILKLYTSITRSIEGLSLTFEKRGFLFILSLNIIIIFAGAAGIFYFENPSSLHNAGIFNIKGIKSYWDGLWWAAMIMTTLGSDYWPKTIGGRILCWFMAIYSFTFFGYITATLASHFIELDK